VYLERHEVSITVSAGGAGTGYTQVVHGVVHAIRYVPDGSSPYDTGFDATITCDVSGLPIITVTNGGTAALSLYPRAATVSVANAAALYAGGGTAVNDKIPVAGEKIKIVIADGGNATTGKFHVYVG
jgi:hypothetical protein